MLDRDQIDGWIDYEAPAPAPRPVSAVVDRPTSWAITDGRMSVYRGGELVAVIPAREFPELAFRLAEARRV